MRRGTTAVVSAVGLALAAAVPAAAESDGKVATISDARITESSGLAASSRHPGVFWTHNDSGGKPQLFAVGTDGTVKATVTLADANAVDWEAIALGKDENGEPALYVADIGDNRGRRTDVAIYRVREPDVLRDTQLTPGRYRIAYEDGPRDAEALMVHPSTNRILVATKALTGGGIYTASGPLRADAVNTLTRTAKAPAMVTDGAYSPDGSRFILRGYLSSDMYSAPGKWIGSVDSPVQKQGESVTFRPDGAAVLFGSEGADSVIWRVMLHGENRPDSVRAPAAPAAPAAPPRTETAAPPPPASASPPVPPPTVAPPPTPPTPAAVPTGGTSSLPGGATVRVADEQPDDASWLSPGNAWLWAAVAAVGLLGAGAVRAVRSR
ncbi:hypothetical protein [Streptodolium elevatio]|uniref:WD40 repeat domain-containing protein n=1 Tax=Streptodolium elevatio TaxID=3157996 RepID=A0ABV3DH25_9ACTN